LPKEALVIVGFASAVMVIPERAIAARKKNIETRRIYIRVANCLIVNDTIARTYDSKT
jgi:hypothetical protein